MHCRNIGIVAVIAACASFGRAQSQEVQAPKTNPWEKAIAAFEAKDRESPPPQGAILFVGSSTIRLWDLAMYFPGVQAINRGFGGSTVADSLRFADRIILPYRPKAIVFYAGDNDIASGKTPEQVFENFKALVAKIRGALPETRVLFLSIKPSVARWALADRMRAANRLVQNFCKTDSHLEYVDVHTPMIGEDGKPRADLLAKDGLHLNPNGYALWTSLLMPRLILQKEGVGANIPR